METIKRRKWKNDYRICRNFASQRNTSSQDSWTELLPHRI